MKSSDFGASNEMERLEKIGEKIIMAYLKYYLSTCLEGLEKKRNQSRQDCMPIGRYSKGILPEYMSGMLALKFGANDCQSREKYEIGYFTKQLYLRLMSALVGLQQERNRGRQTTQTGTLTSIKSANYGII
jgi:hypothetical protein